MSEYFELFEFLEALFRISMDPDVLLVLLQDPLAYQESLFRFINCFLTD